MEKNETVLEYVHIYMSIHTFSVLIHPSVLPSLSFHSLHREEENRKLRMRSTWRPRAHELYRRQGKRCIHIFSTINEWNMKWRSKKGTVMGALVCRKHCRLADSIDG